MDRRNLSWSRGFWAFKKIKKCFSIWYPRYSLFFSLFLKLSLAVFFLRIVVARWQRHIIIIGTSIFCLFTLAFFFIAVLRCGPPSQFLLNNAKGNCLPWSVTVPLNYIHGTLNAITDWIFVSLPILVIRNANMNRKGKASVIGVLLGLCGVHCETLLHQ